MAADEGSRPVILPPPGAKRARALIFGLGVTPSESLLPTTGISVLNGAST
jgi:hypothetical protein